MIRLFWKKRNQKLISLNILKNLYSLQFFSFNFFDRKNMNSIEKWLELEREAS